MMIIITTTIKKYTDIFSITAAFSITEYIFSQIVLVSRVFFKLINRNASLATAGSFSLFATLALLVFQYSGDRNQRGVGDAFVGCLMAVYTYMKLHILAESGPEKKYLAFAVWSM